MIYADSVIPLFCVGRYLWPPSRLLMERLVAGTGASLFTLSWLATSLGAPAFEAILFFMNATSIALTAAFWASASSSDAGAISSATCSSFTALVVITMGFTEVLWRLPVFWPMIVSSSALIGELSDTGRVWVCRGGEEDKHLFVENFKLEIASNNSVEVLNYATPQWIFTFSENCRK